MQLTAEDEMADLLRGCLPELDQVEAAFIRDCWLREPQMPLQKFSESRGLSAKALTGLRKRALVRLKDLLASKNINSVADVV
jgi:hypothetical protein